MDEFISALSIKDPETGEWKGIAALRGEKGDTGDTGPQGPKGDTGTFDYVSATVTNTTGTPAVNVDYDGANATFHFSGIKGETGAKGDTGNTGPQGPKGDTGSTGPQGAAGQDGADGYSPAVTITEITGGHQVKITDKTHPSGQTFDVMDGEDGASDAGDVTYDPTETYADGTVGKALTSQSSQISSLDILKADKTALQNEVARLTAVNARQDKSIEFLSDAIIGVQAKKVTDSTEAYSKAITAYPQFTAKMADVKSIGGKTVVFNQLANIKDTFTTNGITFTKNNDGSVTINGTANANVSVSMCKPWNIGGKSGEKMLFYFSTPIDGVGFFDAMIHSESAATSLISTIGTLNSSTAPYWYIEAGTTISNKTVRVMAFNLTKMFGAGNEPTTVEEFKAQFPNDYYEYDPGSLLSADVDSVVSDSKNIFKFAGRTRGNSTEAFSTEKYFVLNDFGERIGGVSVGEYTDEKITFTSSWGEGWGLGFPIKCKPNTTYYRAAYISEHAGYSVRFYDANLNYISKSTTSQFTTPSNAEMMVFLAYVSGSTTGTVGKIVFAESAITEFTPYAIIDSFNIPERLREDYPLHSAGTVHDSLMFSMVNGALKAEHTQNVGTRAYQEGDESDTTVITDGINTFYPLTTAVITDVISFFPADFTNVLTIEDGGSLTFEQTATEFHIPNTEDIYYVKIPEEVTA